MELSLALTKRCNAQCTHCAPNCGPHETQSLSIEKAVSLMTEAAKSTSAGESLRVFLTGGEVFLDLDQLVEVVRHGAGLGATMSCVTNAFWASSDDRAQTVVARVHEAGLARMAASTSAYHQRFVNIARVRRALSAARAAGIKTLLKIAYTTQDEKEGRIQKWADFVEADELQVFPVVPYLRQGAALSPDHYVRVPGLPKGPCPAAMLTVREDGAAYTCCTPGAFESLLQLGNVFDSSLNDIIEEFHFNSVLQILRRFGPIRFASHAKAEGHGGRLRAGYGDVCDLCAHIASDPVLAACARDSAQEFRNRTAERIAKLMTDKAPNSRSGKNRTQLDQERDQHERQKHKRRKEKEARQG